MRQLNRGLLLLAVSSALTACASSQPVNPSETSSAVAGSEVPKGYHRVEKKGKEYFCRTEAVTGSHTLKNEVCLTRDELEAERTHATVGQNPPSPAQVGR